MAVYLGPYMVVNAWLTIITFLQHTDADVPHYDEKSWTWLKGNIYYLKLGALSTIDRNYPAWIDALQFEIGTTHVVHHLFSDIPHYNARVFYNINNTRKPMFTLRKPLDNFTTAIPSHYGVHSIGVHNL